MNQKFSNCEELLAVTKELVKMTNSIKYASEDVDYDAGHKEGYKKAIDEALDLIYKRVDTLIKELGESDG